MEEKVEIQFKNHKTINNIGCYLFIAIILIILYFIITAEFEKISFENGFLIFLVLCFFIVIAIILNSHRTYEKATLSFIPEGIIIQATKGYIPIKYKDIAYFKSIGVIDSEGKTEFTIETINSRIFRIKSKNEIYEGLIKTFPDKDGKFMS